MKIHLCKITGYDTEQLSHFKDHLKSKSYKLAYDKRLLEVNAMKRDELRKLHKDEGLTNYSKLKKDELITRYMEHMKHVEIKTKNNKKKIYKKETNRKISDDLNKNKDKNIKINVDLISPILKWVGGKTQIIKEVTDKFPNEINNYYEPFVGGGSVFLELLKLIENDKMKVNGKIYINDLNNDLINLYSIIKKDTSILFENIDDIINNYGKAKIVEYEQRHEYNIKLEEPIDVYIKKSKSYVYYYYRKLYNTTNDLNLKTAIFLFLNKTCYRGLFREGPNGFNVPFGNYNNPTIYNKDKILELNKLFNKYDVQFTNLDFEKFSKNIKKNDFVYFDPPYYPLKKTSFTSYKDDSFHDKHDVLVNLCNNLNDDEIKFVHSNSYCKFNLDKYKNYNIEKISCKRRINSKKPEDKDFEVIIHN